VVNAGVIAGIYPHQQYEWSDHQRSEGTEDCRNLRIMSISYLTIKMQSALKLAQIVGVDQATLETAYTGTWATALDGAEIPEAAFKDQILAIGKVFAHIIGSDATHPYRSMLYGKTSNLANLALMPTTDSSGYEFIGVFDAIVDATSFKPLTIQPAETLEDLSNSFFDDTELYNYSMLGRRIQHTRTNVYAEGCVWDMTAQGTLYDNDGVAPLPQMLADGWVSGVVASSVQVGWVEASQAVIAHEAKYQQTIQLLRSGSSGVPNVPVASANVVAG